MSTSHSTDHTTTRNGIITRALRIIGGAGQGETPPTAAITEAAEALNDLVKEWSVDGMPLWCLKLYTVPLVSGQDAYTIAQAPSKVLQAFIRTNSNDTPLLLLTRDEYYLLGSKTSSGTPNQVWYNPPGANQNGVIQGTLTVYQVPDATAAADSVIYLTGIRPFEDFDNAADVPDFPQHWYNALKWGLADQLSYEYGVGLAERAMISKKADKHKEKALEGNVEEGSMFFQPGSQ